MKITPKIKYSALVIVAALIVVILFLLIKNRGNNGGSGYWVLGWDKPSAYGAYLETRQSGDGSQLLLKRTDQNILYSYGPGAQTFKQASAEEWDKSSAAIAKCDDLAGFSKDVTTTGDYKLTIGGKQFNTKGLLAASTKISPDKNWVAAMLVEGMAPTGNFISGGNPTGPHYQQIINMGTGQPVKDPELFITGKNNYLLTPCWSADEKFVIYQDPSLTTKNIWILKTNLP